MARQKPYGGVYENMDFGNYVYQEYPKHIRTGDHGKFEVVQNEEEEKRVRAKLVKKTEIIQAEQLALGPDIEKEKLLLRCKELDIPVNSKWSNQKLYGLIREAEAAVDALPANENLPDGYSSAEEADAEDHMDPEKLREQLIAEAKSLGIAANKTWGTPRLRSNIAEAKRRAAKEQFKNNDELEAE